jgi:hypothetical protein
MWRITSRLPMQGNDFCRGLQGLAVAATKNHEPQHSNGNERNRTWFRRDRTQTRVGDDFVPRSGWVIRVPEQIMIRRRTGDAARVVDLPSQARLSDIYETVRRGVRHNLVQQCAGIRYRNIDSVRRRERRKRRNGSPPVNQSRVESCRKRRCLGAHRLPQRQHPRHEAEVRHREDQKILWRRGPPRC